MDSSDLEVSGNLLFRKDIKIYGRTSNDDVSVKNKGKT